MRLHIAPQINITYAVEEAARHFAEHVGELGRNLPGNELVQTGLVKAMAQRFAEVATPVLVDMALDAFTLVDSYSRLNSRDKHPSARMRDREEVEKKKNTHVREPETQ